VGKCGDLGWVSGVFFVNGYWIGKGLWLGDLGFLVWKTMWKTWEGVGFFYGNGCGKVEMMRKWGRRSVFGGVWVFILQSVSKKTTLGRI
jgi:hypothetical protein